MYITCLFVFWRASVSLVQPSLGVASPRHLLSEESTTKQFPALERNAPFIQRRQVMAAGQLIGCCFCVITAHCRLTRGLGHFSDSSLLGGFLLFLHILFVSGTLAPLPRYDDPYPPRALLPGGDQQALPEGIEAPVGSSCTCRSLALRRPPRDKSQLISVKFLRHGMGWSFSTAVLGKSSD